MIVALILKKFGYFFKRKFFLYFLKRKLFLYSQKRNPALFTPNSKNKGNPPRENFLYLKKQKPQEISYIFSKESCSYFSGNRDPEKNYLYFKRCLAKSENQKIFIFFLIKKQSFLNQNI